MLKLFAPRKAQSTNKMPEYYDNMGFRFKNIIFLREINAKI